MRRGWQCVFMLVCCWSCAGELKDPERFGFVLNPDGGKNDSGSSEEHACLAPLLRAKCASQSGCHAAGTTHVDLDTSGLESRLVDQKAPSSGICNGKTLVASDGSGSLLTDKLLKDPPPCGSKMPLGGTLTSEQQACITDWVSSVADKSGGN